MGTGAGPIATDEGGIGTGAGPIATDEGGIGTGAGPIATDDGGIGTGAGPIATKVAASFPVVPFVANTLRKDTLVSTTRTANTKVRM